MQPSRPEGERDDASLPWQVGELAPVAAMHARRDLSAHRAGCGNGAGAADNNNSVGIRQNLLDHQVGRQEGQKRFRQGTTRTPNCSLYVRTRVCQCEPTIKFADEPIFHADLQRGFLYLVAVMDWATRKVLSWRVSNTMDAEF